MEAIQELRKLLILHRDFYKLLRNYVTFSDFYCTDDGAAIFQAGTLYIDQRSCDLCIRVSDMGKQTTMAGHSGMYLIYCDCVARHSNAKMTIVAVMTDGEVNNLKVGVNAIFYDRQGNDYDATVVKIIDNPISVRQAFWAPYRKMGSFIEDQINKIAAKQDSKVMTKCWRKAAWPLFLRTKISSFWIVVMMIRASGSSICRCKTAVLVLLFAAPFSKRSYSFIV